MRITGGLWGGRTLLAPRGSATRPTSDGNRQALFNILLHGFGHEAHHVADLFAGSGALALEALSHGAQSAIFFENDPEALRVLKKNCENLDLSPSTYSIVTDSKIESWPKALQRHVEAHGPLDLVFCDPPYGKGLAQRALKALLKNPEVLDAQKCMICVEVGIREETPTLEGWVCAQRREKSASAQCFFVRDR
jgi:16S rRNA (guanine966-N2)-methyltransferase